MVHLLAHSKFRPRRISRDRVVVEVANHTHDHNEVEPASYLFRFLDGFDEGGSSGNRQVHAHVSSSINRFFSEESEAIWGEVASVWQVFGLYNWSYNPL